LEGHYNITEVDLNAGEPLLPKANARKFVNQCGVVVRDKVLINIREWKERKDAPMIPFVSNLEKQLMWDAITEHFTLPEGANVELVKSWVLKKMATQFQTWKKKLYNEFVKKNLIPFDENRPYKKLRDQWPEFVRYNTSK
jgi:hypothetical protein